MIEITCNDRLGKKVRVKCNSDDTIGDLKKLIAAQTGTKWDKIVLKKWYTIFKDHIKLEDYEIHDEKYMREMFASIPRKGTLQCPKAELRLDLTLPGGQSFRWHKINETEWRGVFSNRVWTLSQNDDCLFYEVLPHSDEDDAQQLKNYFQLNVSLTDMYKNWKEADKNFSDIAPRFSGVRVLRQDPIENLFSFICSSNNNITRITKMVESMCSLYGDIIADVDNVMYHSFPKPNKLAQDGVEAELKKLKFGYRAAFIYKTAKVLTENKESDWLYKLRDMDYENAHKALTELPGVGFKVADCVCLMSLEKTQAIPVDTHIFKIASQTYMPSLKSRKSLTDKSYKAIGDHLRGIFGSHAGWAQSVLFSSDLGQFKTMANDGDCKRPTKRAKQLS